MDDTVDQVAADDKTSTRHRGALVTYGSLRSRERRAVDRERIKRRIIAHVKSGRQRLRLHADDPVEWSKAPGVSSWWQVRQSIGGRTPADDFRTAVDELIGSGRLVECWCEPVGARDPAHILLDPNSKVWLRQPVAKVRGRMDVLDCDQWFRALAQRGGIQRQNS